MNKVSGLESKIDVLNDKVENLNYAEQVEYYPVQQNTMSAVEMVQSSVCALAQCYQEGEDAIFGTTQRLSNRIDYLCTLVKRL